MTGVDIPGSENLGSAEIQVHVDEETHQRLREEYESVVEAGYTDGFETFVINQLSSEYRLFVDGEPAEHGFDDSNGRPSPTRSEPADFGGGESTGVQDL